MKFFLTQDGFLRKTSGLLSGAAEQCALSEIRAIKVERSSVNINGRRLKEIVVKTKRGALKFGLGLSEPELYYIKKRLSDELARLRGSSEDLR